MDLGRILLERDAPLLLPPKYHGQTKHSNPFMVADVATEIGMIRHMPTEAVLATTHGASSTLSVTKKWGDLQRTHTPLHHCI